MTKIESSLALFASFAFILSFQALAQAQNSPATVTMNAGSTPFIYYKDFDVLALDFNITSVTGDVLETLTVSRSGSAREVYDYTKLYLWADRGVAGFQGMGYDALLAEGKYTAGLWVFDSIKAPFTQNQHRFFVSLASGDVVDDKIAQFSLLGAGENGDGIYQTGEQGIFLKSGVIAKVTDAYSHSLKFKSQKIDANGPRGFLKNVSFDAASPTWFIGVPTPLVLTGEAKDRNGGSVASVKLWVNGKEISAVSTNEITPFLTWKAEYTPSLPSESLEITLQLTDSRGNMTESQSYYAMIDNQVFDASTSTIKTSKAEVKNDGKDQATITVTLKDAKKTLLPNRPIKFVSTHDEETLSETEVTTDIHGQVSVKFASTRVGPTVLNVYYQEVSDANLIGKVNLFVNEDLESNDNNVVIPDEEGDFVPETNDQVRYGSLIKGKKSNAVYYVDLLGKRHAFSSEGVYKSWYGSDFSQVKSVDDAVLRAMPLSTPVTFKPGSLVKMPSVPVVYLITPDRVLRALTTEDIAKKVVGPTWNQQIHDIPESFFPHYFQGEKIDQEADVNLESIKESELSIELEIL